MSTYQVPREQWVEFLKELTTKNQTRNIVLDVESNELGPQRLIDGKPLVGIEPEINQDGAAITVIAGDPEGGHPSSLAHEIDGVSSIWVKEDEEGKVQAVDIESKDGKTIIEFV